MQQKFLIFAILFVLSNVGAQTLTANSTYSWIVNSRDSNYGPISMSYLKTGELLILWSPSSQSGYTMEGVIAPSMQRVLVSPTTNIGFTFCPFVLWPSIIPFGPENQGRWLLSHMSLNDAAFPCTNWTITLQSWDRNALVSAVNIATGFFPFTTVNESIAYVAYKSTPPNNQSVAVAQFDLTTNQILTVGDLWYNGTNSSDPLGMIIAAVDDVIFGFVLLNTTAGTLYKFSLNPFQSTPFYSLGSTLLGAGAILKPSKALAIVWTSTLNVIQLQGLVITKTNLTKRFVIDVSQTPQTVQFSAAELENDYFVVVWSVTTELRFTIWKADVTNNSVEASPVFSGTTSHPNTTIEDVQVKSFGNMFTLLWISKFVNNTRILTAETWIFNPPSTPVTPQTTVTTPSTSSTSSTSSPSSTSSTSSTPSTSPTSSDTTTVVTAVVVSVGGAIVIGGVIFLILFLSRRRRKKQSQREDQKDVQDQNPPQPTTQKYQAIPKTTIQKLTIPESELVFEKEIGGGAFGKVWLGKWEQTTVAIKVSNMESDRQNFEREAALMVGLRPHPHVLQVLGVSIDGKWPCIVMEYCAGGSLDKLLFEKKTELSEKQIYKLLHEIATGMLHLHKNKIVHRDLAARNILLTGEGSPKIADFGMSRLLETMTSSTTATNVGPLRWMAPESLKNNTYSFKTDVWMFGILIYEVVARKEPHEDEDFLTVVARIRDEYLTPKIPKSCDPFLKELMQKCWAPNPDDRPDFETICELLAQKL